MRRLSHLISKPSTITTRHDQTAFSPPWCPPPTLLRVPGSLIALKQYCDNHFYTIYPCKSKREGYFGSESDVLFAFLLFFFFLDMRDQICAVHHTKLSSRMHQEGSRGSKSQHQHTDKWSVSVSNPLRGGWCAAQCVSVIMMADWRNAGRSRRGGPGPPAGRCWRMVGFFGGGVKGIILSPTGVSVRVCWTRFSATLQKFANEITPVLFYRSKSLNVYSLEGCRFHFPVPAEVKTVLKINLLFAQCVEVEGGGQRNVCWM